MNTNNQMKGQGIPLKLISLIFGFAFWYLFMHQYIGYEKIAVPISFHDIPNHCIIDAPEIAIIAVRGKRSALYKINRDDLVFHIDASKFKKGKNYIHLTDHQLFLPEQITLLNCLPSTILVYIHYKTTQHHDDKEIT